VRVEIPVRLQSCRCVVSGVVSAMDWAAVAVDADDSFVFKFDSNDALRETNATKYVYDP
jgi:hypothetical protein